MENPSLLEMRGISKCFGQVRANDGVDLTLNGGDILGLLGENGAGKTTLMNILFGVYTPDSGRIAIAGRPVHIRSSSDALAHGVGMVHQHFHLVARHTVLENLMVGSPAAHRLDRNFMLHACGRLSSSSGWISPWRPGRRSDDRRAAAPGDREGLDPRRPHLDPRRAHGRLDPAGNRRIVQRLAGHGVPEHGDRFHQPQAAGSHGHHPPGRDPATGQGRRGNAQRRHHQPTAAGRADAARTAQCRPNLLQG